MSDDAFPRSSRPPHGQDAADRRDPASDPLMELARLIGQSDPFSPPPGRGKDSPRAPELPTRGPMARPPSSRDISPRAERYEEPPQAERYDEEEPAYEPRPARGHPFPWLQVPPGPAPAESREASHGERSYEEAAYREPAAREPAYREPPPYSDAPRAHPSFGQPAHPHDAYERQEPTFGDHDHRPTFGDRGDQPGYGDHGAASHQHGHYGHAAATYPTVPDQHYAPEDHAAERAPTPGHDDRYPRLDDRQHYAAYPGEDQHDEHARGEHGHGEHGHGEHGHGERREHDPRYAAAEPDEHDEYDPRYAEEGEHDEHDPRYAAAEDDQYDDEYEYADDEDGYADEEPSKRRNLVKIALAGGLGLVVLGTAGAFGYRAMFHGGGSDGPPPLIRADNTPTKVVPTPTADASAKPISDRLGSGERMVSREEQPIDLRDARNANGALVAPVGAGGVAPYPTTPSTTSVAPASTATAPAPTEPKRVRTVTIHADAGSQPAPNAGAAPATQVTAPAGASATGARAPAAPRPAAPPAAAGGNAPLSLTPQSPPTVAAVDTTHPAPPAKTTPPSGGGGWIVQISAQKTEAEAQAAFRAAQAKYSALANQQPLIRKKDQGERGVFYATQVGPFPQREEANQLCETLKGAGGSCFIQRN
jgi:SPOR domain